MKKYLFLFVAALMVASFSSCNKKGEGTTKLEDTLSAVFGQFNGTGLKQELSNMSPEAKMDMDELMAGIEAALKADTTLEGRSYAQGYQMGMQMKQLFIQSKDQGANINVDLFLSEMKQAVKSSKPMDDSKMMSVQQRLQSLFMKIQDENKKKMKAEESKFLSEIQKEGFKKVNGGIYMKVKSSGNGQNFKDGDKVWVKYKGMHKDGSVFDDGGGKAQVFSVDKAEVIPGFYEALKQMKPGAECIVVIPGDLAYVQGNPQAQIKPGEVLKFELKAGKTLTEAEIKAEEAKRGPQIPQGVPQGAPQPKE